MVSLVKNAMVRSKELPVSIIVAYCKRDELIYVQVIDEGTGLKDGV